MAPRKRGRNAVLAMSPGEIYAERRRGMRSTITHAPIQEFRRTLLYKTFQKRRESVADSFMVSQRPNLESPSLDPG